MEIVTKRLLLREFVPDDAPAFTAYHADPRNAEFYSPVEAEPGHARELLRTFQRWAAERPRRNYQLAVAERPAPHEVIGCCGLRGEGLAAGVAEFGIEFAPHSWGYGYATEAARALLAFGFRELGLDEVRGVSVSANVRVVRLVRRLGFTAAGTRPGPAWMQARGWSQSAWELRRDRWEIAVLGRRDG